MRVNESSIGMIGKWIAMIDPPEVFPLYDLRGHEEGSECWCRPFYDEDVLVHNAMDGREKYERGAKKE